jgi:hypothetical protein
MHTKRTALNSSKHTCDLKRADQPETLAAAEVACGVAESSRLVEHLLYAQCNTCCSLAYSTFMSAVDNHSHVTQLVLFVLLL